MRIVGGKFAGRDLTSPSDRRVRPTAEHMRAALLDLLEPELAGAHVLDLFAGTGALGLEAISRGALTCDFVEWRPTSLWALKSNVNRFKLKERTRTFKHDAIHFAEALEAGRYDVAFCDPPYESKQLDWIIRLWAEKRFSRVLAVEHAVTHLLPPGHSTVTSGPMRFTIYRDPASLALPGAPAPVARTIPEPWASESPVARPGSRPADRTRGARGAKKAGGVRGTRSATGTGGARGKGGAAGTGGARGKGGATGTGGARGTGGSRGTGGAPGTRSAPGTGGARGGSGAKGAGGAGARGARSTGTGRGGTPRRGRRG